MVKEGHEAFLNGCAPCTRFRKAFLFSMACQRTLYRDRPSASQVPTVTRAAHYGYGKGATNGLYQCDVCAEKKRTKTTRSAKGIRSFSIKFTATFRGLKKNMVFCGEGSFSEQSIFFATSSVLATRSLTPIFTIPKERRNKGKRHIFLQFFCS